MVTLRSSLLYQPLFFFLAAENCIVVAEGVLQHNGVFKVRALGFPPVEFQAESQLAAKARPLARFPFLPNLPDTSQSPVVQESPSRHMLLEPVMGACPPFERNKSTPKLFDTLFCQSLNNP